MCKINLNYEYGFSDGINVKVNVHKTSMGYEARLSDSQIRKIRRFFRGLPAYNKPFITMDGRKYTHLTTIYNTLSWWRDEVCA